MDDTLGIDCPQNYVFNNSCYSIATPRRLSRDFEEETVGQIEQPKKRFKTHHDVSTPAAAQMHSTPRRSMRIMKKSAEQIKETPVVVKDVPKKIKPRVVKKDTKAEPTDKLPVVIKPRVYKPPPATVLPKQNRTVELRRQNALNRGNKQKPKPASNAIVMKPHFQKPKLYHTVPKTPELIRRLRGQRKRPLPHKSFAEKEEEEIKEMRKYKFKAAPVPSSVKKPVAVVPRVKSEKPVTKPVTPKLSKGKKRKFVEEKPKEFKAKPVPSFSKKNEAVMKPIRTEKKSVEMKPFSFDKRYADPKENRAKLIENHLKDLKEKAKFKATPYFKPPPANCSVAKENRKPGRSANTKKQSLAASRKQSVVPGRKPSEVAGKKKV